MKRINRVALFCISTLLLIGLFAVPTRPVVAFVQSDTNLQVVNGIGRAGSFLRSVTYDFVDVTLLGIGGFVETGHDISDSLRGITYAFADHTTSGLELLIGGTTKIGYASQDAVSDSVGMFAARLQLSDDQTTPGKAIGVMDEVASDSVLAAASIPSQAENVVIADMIDSSGVSFGSFYAALGEEAVRVCELAFASGMDAFEHLSEGFQTVLTSVTTVHRLTMERGYEFGQIIGQGFLALGTYPEEIWYQASSITQNNPIIVETGDALQESGWVFRNTLAGLMSVASDESKSTSESEVVVTTARPVPSPIDIAPERLVANASTALASWWGTITNGVDSAIAFVIGLFSDDDTIVVQQIPWSLTSPSVPSTPSPAPTSVVTTFVSSAPQQQTLTTNIFTTQYLPSTGGGISITQLALAIIGLRDELEPQIELAMTRPRTSSHRSGGGGDDSDVDLSGLLSLTGGTLTGSLSGTSASFSGALSSATLSVAGSTTLNGVEYLFPGADGAGGEMLTTDGAGGLSWSAVAGGITSLGGLTAAVQTFGTSSDTNIGLSIVSSGSTHTFTPAWIGTLAADRGGTGTSTVNANELLIGNSLGTAWTTIATSSLGFASADDLDDYLALADWYATTTDALDEGLTNLYYTDARVASYISGSSTIPHATPTNGNILLGNGTTWLSVATSTLGFASATQIGSGTTGQFPYYAANGTTLTATSSLFLASNGNIGIGTTTPESTLSILGRALFTQSGGALVPLTVQRHSGGSSVPLITVEASNGDDIATLDAAAGARLNLGYNGIINISSGDPGTGARPVSLWYGELSMAGDYPLRWYANNGDVTGGTDIGLARDAAGVLRVTDGSTGTGTLFAGSIGVATSSPYAALSVDGDLALTGGLYDNNATRGASGDLLQSTGTGLVWVSTSTLGFAASSDLANYLTLVDWYATTTDALDEGLTNLYYTDARVASYISGSSTIPHATPTNGNILLGNGTTWLSVATSSLGIPAVAPGGSDTQVQFNDGGVFGGDAGFTYNKTTDEITVTSLVASLATTTSATTTSLHISGSSGFSIAALSGFLKATAGQVATALIDLAADITGTLGIGNGGTGATSFGANRLPFINSGNTAFTSSDDLLFDDSAKILKLGSTTASTQLLLPLSNDATTPTLAFGDGDSGFYEQTDEQIAIAGSGGARMYFELGFGGGNLRGYSTGNSLINFVAATDASSPNYTFANDQDTGMFRSGANQVAFSVGGTSILQLGATNSNFASGNLGIGSSTPTEKLSVNGNVLITGTLSAGDATTTALHVSSDKGFSIEALSGFLKATAGQVATAFIDLATDITGTLGIGNGGTGATSFGANRLPFINSGNTAMTSTSTLVFDGTNLGIGTSSPFAKLSVDGTVAFDGLSTTVLGGEKSLCISQTFEVLLLNDCTSSSIRFKHDIVGLDRGLDLINELDPVSFRFNATDELRFGFIAEEVKKVEPRLITYDSEGQIQGLRYNDIIPVLVNAVQELNKKFDSLADRFSAAVVTFKGIVADRMTTKELCLEDVCITKDELQELLDDADQAPHFNIGDDDDEPPTDDPTDEGEKETFPPDQPPVDAPPAEGPLPDAGLQAPDDEPDEPEEPADEPGEDESSEEDPAPEEPAA